MTKKWKKLEANPAWKFEEEKELTGTYVSMEENVGPNNSKLYTLKKPDDSVIGVWGNTMLDDKFKSIKVGEEVKIIYLGKAKSKKTGNEYNNFEIYLGEAELKEDSAQEDINF